MVYSKVDGYLQVCRYAATLFHVKHALLGWHDARMRTVDRDLLLALVVTATLIGALFAWLRYRARLRRLGWEPARRKLARAAARLKGWWFAG